MLPCSATAEAIVEAAVRGARDVRQSPPLRGADRAPPSGTASPSRPEEAPKRLEPRPEDPHVALAGRDPVEAAFVDEILQWALRTGLCPEPGACPGTLAYVRTAHHMCPDPAVAAIVARYMMLAAVGDVFVFDRVVNDEPHASRLLRLQVSARYLIDAIRSGRVDGPPPEVAGAPYLASLAAQWVELRARFDACAYPQLVRAWCAGAAGLYEDSVREHLPEVTNNPLVGLLASDRNAARERMARYVCQAPPAIRTRLAELFDTLAERPSRAVEAELRVLLYLLDVNTIGAGLALRTAALAVDREDVPAEGPQALDDVLPLFDYRIRLANDRSGFVASSGLDRDQKTNACSLLVPKESRGVEREAVLMRAVGTVDRVIRLVDDALDRSIAQLSTTWPRMAIWVRRGRHIGVTTYEVGHFTTIDEQELDAVFKSVGG
jgi:hypothetical protein